MKLYRFDAVDERLELVPLAARRALDRSGLKLSLDGWKSLSLDQRTSIAEAGSRPVIDVEQVRSAASGARPPATLIDALDDPPADAIPEALVRAYAASGPLDLALWTSLEPIDRYALAKVAARGRPERLAAAYAEIIGHSAASTHLAPAGGVRMIDVGQKNVTRRRAVAESSLVMNEEAWSRLVRADAPKGDVLGAARLAGIMAAKRTSELIPLCHAIKLTRVDVAIEALAAERRLRFECSAEAVDQTGVEMEALVAASVAALTAYDMLKAFDRAMTIGPTRLLAKSGGRTRYNAP